MPGTFVRASTSIRSDASKRRLNWALRATPSDQCNRPTSQAVWSALVPVLARGRSRRNERGAQHERQELLTAMRRRAFRAASLLAMLVAIVVVGGAGVRPAAAGAA